MVEMKREVNRALVLEGSELKLIEKAMPRACPGHVVVRITMRPIHPGDMVFIRNNQWINHWGLKGFITPGHEGFGIVHEVGAGVSLVKLGQRVVPLVMEIGRQGEGTWQDYILIKESDLVIVPDSIPDEYAAQFVVNPWSAIGMLRDLNVPKGDYLLQTAAGSVLGRMVIQLCKYLGIKTINIVRREELKAELKALGADEVICSSNEDILSRVKSITKKRLAFGALDCIGGDMTTIITACVRRGGTTLIFGMMDGANATVRIHDLFRQVNVTGWILFNTCEIFEHRKFYIEETWRLMQSKIIQPLSGDKYQFEDFSSAIKRSEDAGHGGKVLLIS